MTRRPPSHGVAATLLLVAASTFPAQAVAQLNELAVEVGGSRVTPPAGVDGDAAQYLVAGLRFTRLATTGTGINGSFLFGRTRDGTSGGDYLSGSVTGAFWNEVGRQWHLGFQSHGIAFDVAEPFGYRVLALEGGPAVQFRGRRFTGTLKGVAGVGRSRTQVLTEVSSQGGGRHSPVRTSEQLITLEEDLWRYGTEAELLVGSRAVAVGVAGGTHWTAAGSYSSAGARLLAGRGEAALEIRVDYWDTPVGTQTTGGLAFIVPFGGWSFRSFFGRSEPDPLTLTEPGRGSGGVLVSRRVIGGSSANARTDPLYRIMEAGSDMATVRIEVEAPLAAGSVEVLGDFTLWEPLAMRRDGNRWRVSLQAPMGVHHFGFLVDGEWFLPADAPDAVPDEWGRRSATMVIER